MKIAVAISGQARPLITYTGKDCRGSLNSKLITPNNADVYCVFWHDNHSDALIDEFKPKAYLLPSPDEFADVKQKFFDDYCRQVKVLLPDLDLDERLNFLNGEKHRDNTLRMFYMMDKVINLIGDGYDYIVRVRPDLYFDQIEKVNITSIPKSAVVNNYWMSDKHKIKSCDHFFYSSPANMRLICDWGQFANRLVEMDLLGNNIPWIHPETVLHHIIVNSAKLNFYGDRQYGTGVARSIVFPGHKPVPPVIIKRNI